MLVIAIVYIREYYQIWFDILQCSRISIFIMFRLKMEDLAIDTYFLFSMLLPEENVLQFELLVLKINGLIQVNNARILKVYV